MGTINRWDIERATGAKLDELGRAYGGMRPNSWNETEWRGWILGQYDQRAERARYICKAFDFLSDAGKGQPERAHKVGVVSDEGEAVGPIDKGQPVRAESADERAKRLTQAGFSKDAAKRKGQPVATGVLDYFPLALIAIAEVSKAGNDQHNPGEPLHWARDKSTDEADAALRHFLQRGTWDGNTRHSAQAAWRMLALLQKEIEDDIERGEKRLSLADAEKTFSSPHDAGGPSAVDSARAKMIENMGETFTKTCARAWGWQYPEPVKPVEMSNGCPKALPDTWKPIVIIESPYAGHTKRNMLFLKYAERDCLRRGFIPIASHRLFTEALDDEDAKDRELGMQAGFELHRLADRQIVYNELGVTPGMQRGITQWNEIHKHCRPTDWRMLPDDLRKAFEQECKTLGARP